MAATKEFEMTQPEGTNYWGAWPEIEREGVYAAINDAEEHGTITYLTWKGKRLVAIVPAYVADKGNDRPAA